MCMHILRFNFNELARVTCKQHKVGILVSLLYKDMKEEKRKQKCFHETQII